MTARQLLQRFASELNDVSERVPRIRVLRIRRTALPRPCEAVLNARYQPGAP